MIYHDIMLNYVLLGLLMIWWMLTFLCHNSYYSWGYVFQHPEGRHQKKIMKMLTLYYEYTQKNIYHKMREINMKTDKKKYPPPLQGSLKPLKKIMLLPNLFRTLSIFCAINHLQLSYVSLFKTIYIKEFNKSSKFSQNWFKDLFLSYQSYARITNVSVGLTT